MKFRDKVAKSTLEFHEKRAKNHCESCGDLLTKTGHLDHDHRDDEVRGILCHRCNVGIGWFNDSPARLLGAVRYLRGEYATPKPCGLRLGLPFMVLRLTVEILRDWVECPHCLSHMQPHQLRSRKSDNGQSPPAD